MDPPAKNKLLQWQRSSRRSLQPLSTSGSDLQSHAQRQALHVAAENVAGVGGVEEHVGFGALMCVNLFVAWTMYLRGQ